MNIAKILRTPFLQNTSERLLLNSVNSFMSEYRSYRNQFIDLCKSFDWFLYDRDLRYKRVELVSFLTHIRPILLLCRNQLIDLRSIGCNIKK